MHNQNAKLKAEIKGLESENKELSDSRDMYFKIVRHAESDVKQHTARIKELEAALARAEGLNKAFADGGVVPDKIKAKDIRI